MSKTRIQQIADFLINPDNDRDEVLATFGKKWQAGVRTIDRYIATAKKINKGRLEKAEKETTDQFIEQKKEALKKALLTKEDKQKILADIANGKTVMRVEGTIIIPTCSDRIRAIGELNKMDGDYATEKIDLGIHTEELPAIYIGVNQIENKK